MAKERIINTKFWSDNYISNLDPIEKLLFLYFLTNEKTNICGIYELPIKYMSIETGIEKEMLEKIFKRFEKEKKIIYKDGWLVIVNFLKHQHNESEKVISGIIRELKTAPEDTVLMAKEIGYGYGMDRVWEGYHILNLTKLNLTKPKNDDDFLFKKKKNKDWIDVDWSLPFNKAHHKKDGKWVVEDIKGIKYFYDKKIFTKLK